MRIRNPFTVDRVLYAGFGVLSTVVGMAVGYLVANFLVPASSPVFAVGETVIDHTPHQLKDWAIRHFGTHDKTILLSNVLVGVILFAIVAGLLTLKRFVYGAAMLVVLVAVAAYCALTRPAASFEFVIPSIATVIAGLGTLYLLDRSRRPAHAPAAAVPATTPVETPADADADRIDSGATAPTPSAGPKRRTVLTATGGAVVVAVAAGGSGKLLSNYHLRAEHITLPAPADPAPAFPVGLETRFPKITPLRISNDKFYRVDTRLDVPVINSRDWSLTIDGDVDHEVSFSFDDILAMPLMERDITLTCVSNSVGGGYIGSARWLGVRLTDLLDKAGVSNTKADQLLATDYQGMTIGSPYKLVTDGRDAMLVVGMNGEQLPREHGFPARIIIPGLYGMISATKWVERLTLTTYAEKSSYWHQRTWSNDAIIKPENRIDTPASLESVKPGPTIVGGVAWAQEMGGVAKVQVSIDGGPWTDATLGPEVNNDYWRQWYYKWDAKAGSRRVRARMIDGNGEVQTSVRAEPHPNGASGIPELLVSVG